MNFLIPISIIILLVSCDSNHENKQAENEASATVANDNSTTFPAFPETLSIITNPNLSSNAFTSIDSSDDNPFNHSSNGKIDLSATDDPFADSTTEDLPPSIDQLFTSLIRVQPPTSQNSSPTDVCYDITESLIQKGLKTRHSDWIIFNQTRNTITTSTSLDNQRIIKELLEYHVSPRTTLSSLSILSIQIQEISIAQSNHPPPLTIEELTAVNDQITVRTVSTVMTGEDGSLLKIPKINPFKHPNLTVQLHQYRTKKNQSSSLQIQYQTPTHTLNTTAKIPQTTPLIIPLPSSPKVTRDHFLIINTNQIPK